ncbi:ABC transporter, partial [Achromatium sp. WMS1]
RWLVTFILLGMLAGCASVPDGYRDPRDPLESYNRTMFKFNSDVDEALWQPIAKGYYAITPAPIDRGITNFFNNLKDVGSAANNLLQFKFSRAASDIGRFLINSTAGILGFMDIASRLNLPSYKEDFGQTLGFWGLGPGPYIVLPMLGPSNLRDSVSIIPDWYASPTTYTKDPAVSWSTKSLNIIDMRSDLLDASKILNDAALDPYTFTRNAYLQKRRNDVYDGDPPVEEDALDFDPADEDPLPGEDPQSPE